MRAWGNTTDRILLLLEQESLTKAEICRKLDLTHDRVASVLSRLNKRSKQLPKRIYISGHTRHTISGRTYIRPIYSLGDKPDKSCKIKPFTVQERSKRSYEKLVSLRNSSVFTQTLTRRQLSKMRAAHD
jgi:hypothetical protein